MTAVIIIPARYKSSRYPGKPLVPLAGVTAIERTWRIGVAAAKRMGESVQGVYVATDDERIAAAVRAFGGDVLMTPESCRNGTERTAAALSLLPPVDIAVNLQGDAVLIPPWFIEDLIAFMQRAPHAEMATPVLRCDASSYANLTEDRRMGRVGGTTAVCGVDGRALYFSKEVVPYLPAAAMLDTTPVYHHVGLYAYRPAALMAYPSWPIGPLEKAEQLEQLRFLEQGRAVYAVEVDARGRHFWEINNPADVPRIEWIIATQGEVLAQES